LCDKNKNTVKVNRDIVAELNSKTESSKPLGKENCAPVGKENCAPEFSENQDSIPEIVPEKAPHPEKDQVADNTDTETNQTKDPEECTQHSNEQPTKLKDCCGGVWASDEDSQLQEAIQASLREQGIVRHPEVQDARQTGEQNCQTKSPQEQADLDALLAASLAYEEEEAANVEKDWQRTQAEDSKEEHTTVADPEEDHERAHQVQAFLRSNGFKDDVNALIRKRMTKVRPLHFAVQKADAWLVESLIWAGADCSLVDGKNRTPLALAKELNKGNSQKPVIAILEAAN